jgi:hypothetical protein
MSQACFSSQNGDRVWGVYYRRAAYCCAFLWAKGLNAKDIHIEIVPVHGGKCLSRKAVHNWVANVSLMTKRLKRRCESGWGNSWEDFYSAGFDALVKRWDKCMNVGGGYFAKLMFFIQVTCFVFHIHLWPIYWFSLVSNEISNFSMWRSACSSILESSRN